MLKEHSRMSIITKLAFARSEIKLELSDEYFEVWQEERFSISVTYVFTPERTNPSERPVGVVGYVLVSPKGMHSLLLSLNIF